jgi:radical SAM superfamily enzyme YgiQ (UPF0313 family)
MTAIIRKDWIVAGGEHVTGMGEYSLRDCDALDCWVLGEGEDTIVELVEAKKSNKVLGNIPGLAYRVADEIRVNSRRTRIRGVSKIPWPEWELFPLNAYFNADMHFGVESEVTIPVLASRGCPYLCTFCSSPQMWGTRWEARLPEELLDEIEFYMDRYNATNFDFFDLTAIIRKDWIVAGGEHVTGMGEYSLRDCDALDCWVLGEGEDTIVELVEAKKSNKVLGNIPGLAYRVADEIRVNSRRTRIRGVSKIPWPEWELFPLNAYFNADMHFGVESEVTIPVLASRGCPYLCTFCSSPQMWGTRWEARLPEELLDEIEFYMDRYNATNFDFFDLTAIIRKDWIVAFCKLIIQRGLKINYELSVGTRSEALDDDNRIHT